MFWFCLILLGVYALSVEGGPLSILLLVAGTVGLAAKIWRKSTAATDEHANEKAGNSAHALRLVTMPEDARDVVAAFAVLAHRTYGLIQQMDSQRSHYFYQIVIKLTLGSNDEDSKADFSFEFDYNMEGFHENYGYRLGDGFSVQNDVVSYRSDRLKNLHSWVGVDTTGQGYGRVNPSVDGIVATVVDNCPAAFVNTKYATENEFYVQFKFK